MNTKKTTDAKSQKACKLNNIKTYSDFDGVKNNNESEIK